MICNSCNYCSYTEPHTIKLHPLKEIYIRIIQILKRILLAIPLHKSVFIQVLAQRATILHSQVRIPSSVNIRSKEGLSVAEFDVSPRSPFELEPLNHRQLKKAQEIRDQSFCPDKKLQMERLIGFSYNSWATLEDFNRGDWRAYDEVNFELTQDYFKNLAIIFTTPKFKQNENLLADKFSYKEAMVSEALCKGLAYVDGQEGKTILLPMELSEGIQLVEYQIGGCHFGENLPGYILTSTTEGARPWLIARGTQTLLKQDHLGELRRGAAESMRCDFDPDSITGAAINKALEQPAISQLFANATDNSINLCGHSLGGALVNDLITRFPDKVRKSYTFNPPGMGPHEISRWTPSLDEKSVAFDMKGDLIPTAGISIKGNHYQITRSRKEHLTVHHNAMFLNQAFKIEVIDNHRENRRLARVRVDRLLKFLKKINTFFYGSSETAATA